MQVQIQLHRKKNQAKYQLIEECCICLGSKYVAK